MRTRSLPALALVVACAAALTACGSADSTPAGTTAHGTAAGSSSNSTAAGSSTDGTAPIAVDGAWIKATSGTMTGVFATLTNPGSSPVKVVSASSPVAAMTQLHATVKDANGQMVMQEAKGGFTVPAGGTFKLAPGANHIMLMKLTKPVLSGVPVPITLTLDNGRTLTFDAQGREFNGAKETYGPTLTAPGTPAASMSPMQMTSTK